MAANVHTFTAAAGASSAAYLLPYTSFLTVTFQILPGTSTVAVETSLTGTTWTALTGMTAVASAGVFNYSGPLPQVRITVTGGTTATVHMAWGDNR